MSDRPGVYQRHRDIRRDGYVGGSAIEKEIESYSVVYDHRNRQHPILAEQLHF
jgi:hypothetical protein